jgi:hypothetical protein
MKGRPFSSSLFGFATTSPVAYAISFLHAFRQAYRKRGLDFDTASRAPDFKLRRYQALASAVAL